MSRPTTDEQHDLLAQIAELGAEELTVCPEHLRFAPCRRCAPGQARYSTDPDDVRRTREHQTAGV